MEVSRNESGWYFKLHVGNDLYISLRLNNDQAQELYEDLADQLVEQTARVWALVSWTGDDDLEFEVGADEARELLAEMGKRESRFATKVEVSK